MKKIDSNLAAVSEILVQRQPLPPLSPKQVWREDLRPRIDALAVDELVKGILHLLNDDLMSAHRVAMSMEDENAKYLHALVHRREGDFSNARYWLKTLREQPVWSELKNQQPDWCPLKFLAWCESCAEGHAAKPCARLEEMQAKEMCAFFKKVAG